MSKAKAKSSTAVAGHYLIYLHDFHAYAVGPFDALDKADYYMAGFASGIDDEDVMIIGITTLSTIHKNLTVFPPDTEPSMTLNK